MKKPWLLLFAFVVVGMFGALTACSGDDDKKDDTPRAGLWTGAKIRFFVAGDGESLTTSGSPLATPDGRASSVVLGPYSAPCGTATSYILADIPISGGKFTFAILSGEFSSSSEASGTYSSTIPNCGTASGSWSATATAGKTARSDREAAVVTAIVPIINAGTGAEVGVTVLSR